MSDEEGEIRRCLHKGAHVVQMDFTEGRLSIKLDPTRRLLHSFIDLNNLVLERFSAEERKRMGVHTCPGADRHSAHSADVDYAELLPSLFELQATHFYMQLASEPDRLEPPPSDRERGRKQPPTVHPVAGMWADREDIGATALTHHLMLATLNTKPFASFPGLHIERPY